MMSAGNENLAEIRRTRDDLAQKSGYDLQRLFDYVRQCEREASERSVKFVSYSEDQRPESSVVRDEPLEK